MFVCFCLPWAVLFAGTQVQEGEGRMLVLAVGENTYQGHMEQKMNEAESGRSILQKKLDNMTVFVFFSFFF